MALPANPPRPKLILRFLRDAGMRVAIAVIVLVILPYAIPIFDAASMVWYGDLYSAIPLLLLSIGLAAGAVTTSETRAERRFWIGWLLGLWMWTIVQTLYVFGPDSWAGGGFDLVADLLFVLFYLFIILALERQGAGGEDSRGRAPRVSETGVFVFLFVLVLYFVVIPSALSPDEYDTWVPSTLLYSVLDLYIVTKLVFLFGLADSEKWRVTYGLLLATAVLWMLTDFIEAMTYIGLLPEFASGTWWDLMWYLPFLSLAAGLRAPAVTDEAEPVTPLFDKKGVTMSSIVRGGSLIVFAFVLPALHLLFNGFGWLDPSIREPRDWLTLAALGFFAVLAFLYQRILVRDKLAVEAEHQLKVERNWRGQMDAVQRLAAGIAHDLDNAIAVVDAASQVIAASDDLPERIKPLVQQVGAGADRARSLTDQLKTIGGAGVDSAVPVEIKKFVMGILDHVQGIMGPDIELLLNVEDAPGKVSVEHSQLETVFVNLAINAKQAMNGQGKLKIGLYTEVISAGDERLAPDLKPGKYARLSFEDHGDGMDPDVLDHVFEPYFTTKPEGEGSGLGLAMVLSIARKAGGFIVASSEKGEGSNFDFYLPVVSDHARNT